MGETDCSQLVTLANLRNKYWGIRIYMSIRIYRVYYYRVYVYTGVYVYRGVYKYTGGYVNTGVYVYTREYDRHGKNSQKRSFWVNFGLFMTS